MDNEEKIVSNIYPRLNHDNITPSAPPAPIENVYVDMINNRVNNNNNTITNINNNQDNSDYRMNYINDIKKYIQHILEERYKLSKKYGKASNILYYTSNSLNFLSASSAVAGISTLPTVFLLPVSIALSTTSAICGGLSIFINKINKKIKVKEEKHRDICNLAEIKLNTIESLISKAIENNHINHNEFQLILDELKKFNHIKHCIRTRKNNDKISSKDDEELKEDGRKELKDSLKKLINSTKYEVNSNKYEVKSTK